MAGKQLDFAQLLQRDQPRAQTVVDIMVVVGDFVGKVANLGLQRWLASVEKRSPTSPS